MILATSKIGSFLFIQLMKQTNEVINAHGAWPIK
jgi:hypothetical protein